MSAFQGAFLFRLKGSTLFRPTRSVQLALGGQTQAAFPRFKKSAVVRYPDILYQIDKYFTVCCTMKCISAGSERIFQYTVVFYYSV